MSKEEIKVVPREEAIWKKVKDEAELLIKQSEDNLLVQKAMLEMASKKVHEYKKAK